MTDGDLIALRADGSRRGESDDVTDGIQLKTSGLNIQIIWCPNFNQCGISRFGIFFLEQQQVLISDMVYTVEDGVVHQNETPAWVCNCRMFGKLLLP